MAELKPEFNPEVFEVYGSSAEYLTDYQLEQLNFAASRVNNQLDWVAQLLGWSGPDYWDNLPVNLSQKRDLLTGSFGVYNSFLYPEVREIRNWDNSVVIRYDDRIEVGQIFYLGDNSYELKGLTIEGDNCFLDFGGLSDQFISDIQSNFQLKVNINSSRPSPFNRKVRDSSDLSMVVKADLESNTLKLFYITGKSIELPVVNPSFFQGSRVYFNLPVYLSVEDNSGSLPTYEVDPIYDYASQLWYISIPTLDNNSKVKLVYESCELPVLVVKWSFDGGWNDLDTLNNFTGVWGNKGGKLPFHFTFDSLGMYGCDPEKAVSLEPLESRLPFNSLLDTVYYQKAQVSPQSPPLSRPTNQVWWNKDTGALSVYKGECFNCGPWVEIEYPKPPEQEQPAGYVFSNVGDFRSYSGIFEENCKIRILDGEGIGTQDGIWGLTGSVTSPCEIDIVYSGYPNSFNAVRIEFEYSTHFSANAPVLPGKIPVKVKNSAGLSPSFGSCSIMNLNITLTEPYPVILTKDSAQGVNEWYISPPSNLKYIGNTRLFDDGDLLDGQLFWDYSNSNIESRAASVFYYNRWEKEGGEWVIKGDWVQVNSSTSTPIPAPILNYGVIKVFCNDTELVDGESLFNGDFEITYESINGEFKFNYEALTFKGIANLPTITITDSLTTTFRYDITDRVFSGLRLKFNPNPLDTNTPLRIRKSNPLIISDSSDSYFSENHLNVLRADVNEGPAGDNWERYFLRLSPLMERDGSKWQKINLICQNFGLWGSPISCEKMVGPGQDNSVVIFEDAILFDQLQSSGKCLYSEPYLYSNIRYEKGYADDFENSALLPGYDEVYDGFEEAVIENYDPLHYRRVVSEEGSNEYGNWEGTYLAASECKDVSGEIDIDMKKDNVRELIPPIWDYSIYKMPSVENESIRTTQVDANHYKIGYAFFTADLSSAEEACFDVHGGPNS